MAKANVGLVSITEGFDDTTPIGRAMASIIMAFAQMERELIAERTKDALAHKRERLAVYGPTPYGFTRKADRLLPNSSALNVVKEIFARRKEGVTLRAIAGVFNERKIPSPRGAEWSPEAVRIILGNASLYGQVMNGLL